jgi:hypothetical protein
LDKLMTVWFRRSCFGGLKFCKTRKNDMDVVQIRWS